MQERKAERKTFMRYKMSRSYCYAQGPLPVHVITQSQLSQCLLFFCPSCNLRVGVPLGLQSCGACPLIVEITAQAEVQGMFIFDRSVLFTCRGTLCSKEPSPWSRVARMGLRRQVPLMIAAPMQQAYNAQAPSLALISWTLSMNQGRHAPYLLSLCLLHDWGPTELRLLCCVRFEKRFNSSQCWVAAS